jgi:hypothetical protein
MNFSGALIFGFGSVVDPYHLVADPEADPDSTYHPDADPDSTYDPDADPDTTYHPDADPDQTPASK